MIPNKFIFRFVRSLTDWRRIGLGAVLLSFKVWAYQAAWNVDGCQVLKDETVEDMSERERHFLKIYAKYYFDLHSLADAAPACCIWAS